jgi:hypothetical protein
VKEVLEDEVVLSDQLSLDQCEQIVVHLKESDKFRKLIFASGISPQTSHEEEKAAE